MDNSIKLQHNDENATSVKDKPKRTTRASAPEFIAQGSVVKIPMSNRTQVFALIDAEDAPKCRDFIWRMQGKANHEYPSRSPRSKLGEVPGRYVRLHHHILGTKPEKGRVVDHINGDKLDNRKENLRICTQSDNMHNRRKTKNPCTTKIKGVHLTTRKSRPWTAQIRINGKMTYIGSFDSAEEAARAYDFRAMLAFGPHALLNFPIERIA